MRTIVLAKKKHADLFNEFRRLTWHSSESSPHEEILMPYARWRQDDETARKLLKETVGN